MTPYDPLARFVTPRNYSRKTYGSQVAKVARALGKPLYPAQRYIADVAGEIDPDTGTFYYQRIILTVQRQFGKTTLGQSEHVQNACIPIKPGHEKADGTTANREVWYLAQTGKDADAKFLEFLDEWLNSPLALLSNKPNRGKGSIGLPFKNGSVIKPAASTASSGHGYQGDMIQIDEAWSLSADQGKTLQDAFIPTEITRLPNTGNRPQMWITSTEGDISSAYLNNLLDQCRAGDMPKRWAFFDFGLPYGEDPMDLDLIAKYHPGLGYTLQKTQLPDFMDEYKTIDGFDLGGWARAFANIRDQGRADRFITESLWTRTSVEMALTPESLPADVDMSFGVAVTVDATKTIITLAMRSNGHTRVQLEEIMDGTGSAPSRLQELQDRYHGAPIVIDKRGPAGDLADRLTELDMTLVDMTASDFMASGQSFISALDQGRATHTTDTTLDSAASSATRQWSGDAWKVRRKDGDGSAILESAILAHWGASHLPDPEPDPVQIFF